MSEQIQTSATQATNKHGIVLVLAAVMPAMAIISLVPVLPMLMREFGAVKGSEFLVPMALTLPALCVALFSPLAGWLSDRVGRKGLLIGALLIYAAIGILPMFLTNLTHIIGARFGLGIAEAVIMTVATALIGDYYRGAAREKWIGIQIAVVSISAIVLIAASGALGEMIGSRGPFLLYLLAVPIAVASAVILFEPIVTENKNGLEPTLTTTSLADGNGTASAALPEIKVSLPWANLLPLLVITLGVGIFFYTVIVKLGAILGLNGEVSPGLIGTVGAAMNVAVGAGTLLFHKLKEYAGPKLLSIGMALFAVGYGGMGLSGSLSTTIVFAIFASLGAGFLLPTMLTWTMKILPADVRGRGTGLWTGMFFLGQFVAPIVATALYAPVSGLGNVLLLYGFVATVAMVFAIVRAGGVGEIKKMLGRASQGS